MADVDLKVGDKGYIFDHGKYWPARIVCADLIQTFGPIDQIAAYSQYEGYEHTTRLTRGYNPCTALRWVSTEAFKDIERGKIMGEIEKLKERASRAGL